LFKMGLKCWALYSKIEACAVCVTAGFGGNEDVICALLWYYASYSCNSATTCRENLSVPYL